MKQLIICFSLAILFLMFSIYQQDNNRFLKEYENLKHVADDAAAAGGLYFDSYQYSLGKMVFDKTEAEKAIKYIIKTNLHLDDTFKPLPNSYWTDTIKFYIYYFDDLNTTFPYLFQDPQTMYTKLITEPTIVVTINAGKPRYRLSFLTVHDAIRSASYEYYER